MTRLSIMSGDGARRRDALTILIVAILGIFALWPYLAPDSALYWGDIELYFAPMQSFLHQYVTRGIIPLWNPLILCGQPFVGDPQIWFLYPTQIFAGVIEPWRFLTLFDCLHVLLGGVLFALPARENGCSRPASIFAALSFMLGGFFVTKMQFPNMAQAIAYVPPLLMLGRRLALAPGFRTGVAFGAVLGLQLLAAHAQITLMTLYLTAAYALFNLWREQSFKAARWPSLIGWGIGAVLLAACLDAGQLLPILELVKHSDRQVLTLHNANRFVLHPNQLTNPFWPNRLGSPYYGDFRAIGNYWEPACYLGLAPFILLVAGAALAVKRRDPRGLFWLAVVVLSVVLAGGRRWGVYTVAFHLVPGVKNFHDPSRMLMGFAIAAPLLAGQGFDALLSWQPISRHSATAAIVAASLILLTTLDLAIFDRQVYPRMAVPQIEAAVAAERADAMSLALPGHRVIFPPNNDVTWSYLIEHRSFRQNQPEYFASLLTTQTSNVNMLFNVAQAGGYEPEPPKGSVKRIMKASTAHDKGDNTGLDKLCVDSVLTFPAHKPIGPQGYFQTYDRAIWRNPHASAVTRAQLVLGAKPPRFVPLRDVSPDEVQVSVPAHATSGVLTLADTMMPGWTAQVDGIHLPITVTRDGFRQIILGPAPAQTVEFDYRPSSWRIGLYLTLIAAALVAGCAVHAVLSREKSSAPS